MGGVKLDDWGEPVLDEWGDPIPLKPKRARIQCNRCPPPTYITWAEQRQGYGRLVNSGLSEQVIKEMGALCPRCVGIKLSEMGLRKWPNRKRWAR
jgi:hypothetical protein